MFFFLMIRRPPRSTLFPTRRSSDLDELVQAQRAGHAVDQREHVRAEVVLQLRVLVQVVEDDLGDGVTLQRSEEHTSELQSRQYLVCRLLLEKKKKDIIHYVNRIRRD